MQLLQNIIVIALISYYSAVYSWKDVLDAVSLLIVADIVESVSRKNAFTQKHVTSSGRCVTWAIKIIVSSAVFLTGKSLALVTLYTTRFHDFWDRTRRQEIVLFVTHYDGNAGAPCAFQDRWGEEEDSQIT